MHGERRQQTHLVVEHVVSDIHNMLIYSQELELRRIDLPLGEPMQYKVEHLRSDSCCDSDME